tara:strand:+ start:3042 stop:3395 length:354 start_codon:yes stop_codon:yes gene_type:complete
MPYLPTSTKYKWMRKIVKVEDNRSYSKPEHAKLYNTTRWRKMRNMHIKHNPLCVVCKKNNRIKVADVVDHIVEVADGGNMYDYTNLQSLCDYHHRSKTSYAVHRRKKNKKDVNSEKK